MAKKESKGQTNYIWTKKRQKAK